MGGLSLEVFRLGEISLIFMVMLFIQESDLLEISTRLIKGFEL